MDMTPHDRFVRRAFSDAGAAADLLRQALPQDVIEGMMVSQVRVRSESFVDQALRQHVTDLLLEVPMIEGRGAFVYVLVEHKAEPDRWVMLQLYRYTGQIWRTCHDDQPAATHLPLIIPLVVYNGHRTWRQPLDFQRIVELHSEARAELVPRFRALLYDVGAVNARDLRAGERFLTTIVALQAARDFAPRLAELLVRLLRQAPGNRKRREFLASVLRYLLQALEPSQQPILLQEMRRQHFREGEYDYMTIADSLQQDAKKEVLMRQLHRRYGLTAEERTRIQASTDAEALDRALDAFATADSKAAVLQELG